MLKIVIFIAGLVVLWYGGKLAVALIRDIKSEKKLPEREKDITARARVIGEKNKKRR